MSEAMTIPPLGEVPAKRTPTVYFIDDSATMREVIKIAFRHYLRRRGHGPCPIRTEPPGCRHYGRHHAGPGWLLRLQPDQTKSRVQ